MAVAAAARCPYCQDAADPGHLACPLCLAYYADFFDSALYRRLHKGKAPEALAHHEAWLAARDGVAGVAPPFFLDRTTDDDDDDDD